MQNIDRDAEKAIIGAIFNHGNDVYIDVSDIVTVNSFADDLTQIIYRVAQHHFKVDTGRLDFPTFLSHCNSLGYSDIISKPKIQQAVKDIANLNADPSSARKLASKVRRLEVIRTCRKEMSNADTKLASLNGDESIHDIISYVEKPSFDLSSLLINNDTGPKKIFQNIDEYLDYLESNPVKQLGLSTGYDDYDLSIGGGLRRKTVNMVGARAKIGKSAICANISNHNIQKGIPVFFADTELSEEDQKHRMLAMLSGVPQTLIETGQYASSLDFKKRVRDASAKLKDTPYHYQNISGISFEEFLSVLRRWVIKDVGMEDGKRKDCLIIYDYIKLMSDTTLKNLQEFQALGFLMSGLHNFMVKYDTPCFATIQLNRDGITREDTDVASGSDRLVWLCSNFAIYKQQSQDEMDRQREANVRRVFNRKLLTLAARHGPGMDPGNYLNMSFEGQICRITPGPMQNELSANNNNEGFVTDGNQPF